VAAVLERRLGSSQQNCLSVAHRQGLRAQRRKRGRGIRSILFARQHLFARCATQLITGSRLLSPLLAECYQLLRRSDLLL